MTAGRSSEVIGRESSAVFSTTRSFTNTNPAMLSRLSRNTGNREYSCSRNSARKSPIVAASGMATMSGRGVITSRTSVSPKSTMLWSSRRSSPSIRPSCSPVFRYAFVASLASSAASSGVVAAVGRFADIICAVHRENGPRVRAIGLNVGSRISRTRSGSRATMASGSSSSTMTMKAATLTSTSATSRKLDGADRHRQERGGCRRDQSEQQTERREQQHRVVEVGRRCPGRPLRSATRRSDNLISALKAASMAPR